VDVKRSARRKTLEVQISNGQVCVRAPNYVSERDIRQFLLARSDWIEQKLAEQRSRLSKIQVREFKDRALWPLMDTQITLNVEIGSPARCELIDDQLHIRITQRQLTSKGTDAALRDQLEGWYRAQAQEILSEKSRVFANQIGCEFQSIRVRKTKTRWGHCTSKGVLQYNWLILLAPQAIVDYLVAHEVSHLRHFNHSRQFWSQVQVLCPDYLQRRRWLRDYGFSLWF
jgi:predicted metal-dependent hydrolase